MLVLRQNKGGLLAGVIAASFVFSPVSEATIFGNAVKRFKDDHPHLIAGHPVLVGLATTGVAVDTAHVGGKVASLLLHKKLLAVGTGIVAVGAADIAHDNIKEALEIRGCTHNLHYWKCDGVHGQHVLVVEATDYYMARSKHGAALAKSLEAAGEPAKDDCVPHHIVPWNEGRKFGKDYADGAREILNKCDISIDSAINGVWLPTKPEASCEGAWHPRLHNTDYYHQVYDDLYAAKHGANGSCENVKNALFRIKQQLKNKTYTGVRLLK